MEKAREERTAHVVTISPNNQTPNRLCATPRTAEETMWVIGEVTLMESKEAMDMRKPSVPVMKDPTQKALASLVLNPLARSSTTSLPSPTKRTTGMRRKELTGSMYQDKTMALPFTPWTSRDFLMTTEWGAVTREERAPQTMARVLRGVPSKKIFMKKPVVTRERWMGVEEKWDVVEKMPSSTCKSLLEERRGKPDFILHGLVP